MKLSYRGVSYEPSTASMLEVTEGEMGGTYRGQNWRLHYLRHIPEPAPVHDLKWRGVGYRTVQPQVATPTPAPQSLSTLPVNSSSSRQQRQKILNQVTDRHLRNIQRTLEHRLEVAKAKGDEKLVRILEQESQQMALPL